MSWAVSLPATQTMLRICRLISTEILRLVHPGARMVYVGKQAGLHTRTQEEIHSLLCQFASEGSTVLRLKGGDPFIFGRGGEEAQYLQQRGIRVYTVPGKPSFVSALCAVYLSQASCRPQQVAGDAGITAASGISASLGIPLTHRGLSTSVRFLTGHSREGGEEALDASTAAMVDPNTTLVVYMGLSTLPKLVGGLREAGLPMDTPAVAIERGTTPEERTVFAPLAQLADSVAEAKLQSPTLIIIGQVVAIAPGWDVGKTQVLEGSQGSFFVIAARRINWLAEHTKASVHMHMAIRESLLAQKLRYSGPEAQVIALQTVTPLA